MNVKWTPEQAWTWYNAQAWPCGFNYVPANSISYTEMWMDYAFDPILIDRELALAQEIGFNCLRVVLPFVVWEAEPEAFKDRLNRFAGICSSRGLAVMFALFDDCIFGEIENPIFGQQPDVLLGWYANGWTPSPGVAMVQDSTTWPRLEAYVKDIIAEFGHDPRVWVWDLYNEPTNNAGGDATLPLLERVFDWARQVAPNQPLTAGHWNKNLAASRIISELSDITTFHDYGPPAVLAATIEELRMLNRPMICTEWLNRGTGSTVQECLPIFRAQNVGCMHWGLVNGKTQTNLNWGHRPGQPDPAFWQHDLYRGDHSAYRPEEIEAFAKSIAPTK